MPKVLVVENELNIQKLVKANLTASGYQVVVADNGEEGLRLAQLKKPDLLLLDLMMPGMSGWDVLAALKADRKLQGTPVLIMTAAVKEGKEDEDKARMMGAAGYLAKPFTADELLGKVKQVLGE